jgi:hypothetical protein
MSSKLATSVMSTRVSIPSKAGLLSPETPPVILQKTLYQTLPITIQHPQSGQYRKAPATSNQRLATSEHKVLNSVFNTFHFCVFLHQHFL